MGRFEYRIRPRYYQKTNHIFFLEMTWELNTNEIQLWLRNLGKLNLPYPKTLVSEAEETWLLAPRLGYPRLQRSRQGEVKLGHLSISAGLCCPGISREGRMLCLSNSVLCFV